MTFVRWVFVVILVEFFDKITLKCNVETFYEESAFHNIGTSASVNIYKQKLIL